MFDRWPVTVWRPDAYGLIEVSGAALHAKGLEVKFSGRGAVTARDLVHLFHALDELSKKLSIHL